ATVIDAYHDVTFLGEHPMPELTLAPPNIKNVLARRFAIDMKQDGEFLVRIEVRRAQTPAVQQDVRADVDAEELTARLAEGIKFLSQFLVVLQHPHGLVLGQSDQLDDRRPGKGGVGVDSPLRVWGNLIAMRARLIRWCETLRSTPIQGHAIEVALSRIIR